MSLSKKGMLLSVSMSIPSGRKVDKGISEKVASDYNVKGGSRDSGNFNKITISSKYLQPFRNIKSNMVESPSSTIKTMTLPWLHESGGVFILPNKKLLDFAGIWRKQKSLWDSEIQSLKDGKYQEALDEAEVRLNKKGGMFNRSDYLTVDEFTDRFKMDQYLRPIPEEQNLDLRASVGELEAERIRKEVYDSVAKSMEKMKELLTSRIESEMHGLKHILASDRVTVYDSRMEGLRNLIDSLSGLNFTDDIFLTDLESYMKKNLYLYAHDLRGNETKQREAYRHINKVIGYICKEETFEQTMSKLDGTYGY